MLIDDRFHLESEIGSGGFSYIWKARDLDTNTSCALKFMKKNDQNSKSIFFAEKMAISGVNHKNVVKLIKSSANGKISDFNSEIAYIALELGHSYDLHDLIELGRFETPMVYKVFSDFL